MILVTGTDERYYPRIVPYLGTLEEFADFTWRVICVGFDAPNGHGIRLDDNAGAPAETKSIQHGSFLTVIDAPDDEVIVYTDGDFVMQRPIDDSERQLLDLADGEVVAGFNFGPQCTLANDARIIGPRYSIAEISNVWGPVIHTAQDYNAGFLAMTRSTWNRLHRAYMDDWDRAGKTFAHQARQQWLISYEIAVLGLTVKLCPWSLHAHGHGGLKPGMYYGADGVYADGKKALFRHYL